MLDPEYLRHITDRAEENASRLHNWIISKIIERMTHRFDRGDPNMFTSIDDIQITVLQEAGELLEDIQAEISRRTGLQEEIIADSMEEACIKTLEVEDKVYSDTGLSPTPLKQSPEMLRQMQRAYEATNNEMKNLTHTTAEAAQNRFIEECDDAYNKVLSGAQGYSQACTEAIENIAKDGVRIEYPTGHSDTVETATLRAVRTGISQATGDITMLRLQEMGWDLIRTSAHYGARIGDGGENPGNHSWWQGKLFTRTGESIYPDFVKSTGYGTIEGICGVNCRHSFGAGSEDYNPYPDIDSEENARIEKINKQMRAYERRLRKTKRELLAYSTAIDNTRDEQMKFELQQKYDKKANLLRMQNQAYKEYCEENKVNTLQERTKIAEWNRQEAARANGGAKRYKNAKKD